MPTFQYTARSQSGSTITGTMEAENPNAVASQLIKQGITPVKIKGKAGKGGRRISATMDMGEIFPPKVTSADLIKFTRSLSSLTKAGVPGVVVLKSSVSPRKREQWLQDHPANVLITNPRDIPGFVAELKKWQFSSIVGLNTLFVALMDHPEFAGLENTTRTDYIVNSSSDCFFFMSVSVQFSLV